MSVADLRRNDILMHMYLGTCVVMDESVMQNAYLVSSDEALATSNTAKKYWEWIYSPARVPTTWDAVQTQSRRSVLRVLITWPELCRQAGISLPKNKLMLGRFRDNLLRGPAFTLERWVDMYEHDLRDWWRELSPASRWQMLRLSHADVRDLRSQEFQDQF